MATPLTILQNHLMDVQDALGQIPAGSLRSYSWLASRLGYGAQGARAAGRSIAKETLARWASPDAESVADASTFPWWRIVGVGGEVRTESEDPRWFMRQVERLQEDGHELSADGLRVSTLPDDFE